MALYATRTPSYSATTVAYVQIHDGYKNAIATGSAAWRLSDQASPDAGEYNTCAAGAQILLPRGVISYARGDSATSTINVVIQDQ